MIWMRKTVDNAEWGRAQDEFESIFMSAKASEEMVLISANHPSDAGGAILYARLPEYLSSLLSGFEKIEENDVPGRGIMGLVGHAEELDKYIDKDRTR